MSARTNDSIRGDVANALQILLNVTGEDYEEAKAIDAAERRLRSAMEKLDDEEVMERAVERFYAHLTVPAVTDEPTPLLEAFAAEGRAALAGGESPVCMTDDTTRED